MAKFSLCALVYTNVEGKKVRLKAHSVFDDATAADIEKWEGDGNVRDATIGEIAEAVAAGKLDKAALPKAPSARKGDGADKKAADAGKADGGSQSTGSQSAGNSQGSQATGDGAAAGKRQDLV